MFSIIAFDPGYATGVAEGVFSEDVPLQLVDAGIISYPDWPDCWAVLAEKKHDHLVVERFVDSAGNDFAFSEEDLTGVKVIGTLELLYGEELRGRLRSTKSQVPDELLKEVGWWKTGEDVDWEDGRDANDAIIHMLGYVAFDLKHKPTLREYFR